MCHPVEQTEQGNHSFLILCYVFCLKLQLATGLLSSWYTSPTASETFQNKGHNTTSRMNGHPALYAFSYFCHNKKNVATLALASSFLLILNRLAKNIHHRTYFDSFRDRHQLPKGRSLTNCEVACCIWVSFSRYGARAQTWLKHIKIDQFNSSSPGTCTRANNIYCCWSCSH